MQFRRLSCPRLPALIRRCFSCAENFSLFVCSTMCIFSLTAWAWFCACCRAFFRSSISCLYSADASSYCFFISAHIATSLSCRSTNCHTSSRSCLTCTSYPAFHSSNTFQILWLTSSNLLTSSQSLLFASVVRSCVACSMLNCSSKIFTAFLLLAQMSLSLSKDCRNFPQRWSISDSAFRSALFAFSATAIWAAISFLWVRSSVLPVGGDYGFLGRCRCLRDGAVVGSVIR